jgi:hypothetical protein
MRPIPTSSRADRRGDRIRRSVLLPATVLALYAAGLLFVRPSPYPVTTWDLFSEVPQQQSTIYRVLVVAVDGSTLDHPSTLAEAQAALPAPMGSATAAVQQLGRSLARHDAPATRRLRGVVEQARFAGSEVRYQVVAESLDLRHPEASGPQTVLGEFSAVAP